MRRSMRTTARCRVIGAVGALAVALCAGMLCAGGGSAETSGSGKALPNLASAGLSPHRLPRSQPAPVTLRMGFKSPLVGGSTPELDRIELDISRQVSFQTAGLESCSLARLYATTGDARDSCPRSLVGHGTVSSEITVPGQAPAAVTGRLLAFYALAEGRPRILAQVTTGDPLPLVYVIPFTIEETKGSYGASLYVPRRRMRTIKGKCVPGYPACFAPSPYTLEGVYGHISKFDLSLHRLVATHGAQSSFVNATCPAPPRFPQAIFRLLKVNLSYSNGASLTSLAPGACRASLSRSPSRW